jgi:hypothetical protein
VTLLEEGWQAHDEKHAGRRDVLSLAWWAGLASVISGFLAVLIGNKGLAYALADLSKSLPDGDVPQLLTFPPFDFGVALLHVLVIALFLVLRFTEFGAGTKRAASPMSPAGQAHNQFLRGWTSIWIVWLVLYSWLAVCWGIAHQRVPLEPLDSRLVWAIADVLNMASAVAFFYVFLVLDQPSVPTAADADRDRGFRVSLVGICVVSALVATLSALGRYQVFGLDIGGPLLASLLAAVAMAFLFGRLDSHNMKVRRWTLAPLYLYVAIQVVWGGFSETGHASGLRSALFCLALLLKLYLFVVVTHWLREGYIFAYLQRIESQSQVD